MTKPMISIKTLHKYDKPREKLAAKGVQALKNEELLSVLLGSGIQGKDVRKLSKEIISMLDSDFENLTLDKLCEVHSLGLAKASQILASMELSKRYLIRGNKRLTSAQDVYEELKSFSARPQEHFLTITLDGASHIIKSSLGFLPIFGASKKSNFTNEYNNFIKNKLFEEIQEFSLINQKTFDISYNTYMKNPHIQYLTKYPVELFRENPKYSS